MIDPCRSNTLISLEQALKNITIELSVINDNETIGLPYALGRVLNQDCIAPFNLPSFPNAAMDGYAFNSHDMKDSSFYLTKIGTSWAGHPFTGTIARGECVRIFTGAVLPDGADSVIMQEQVTENGAVIHFPAHTVAQQNIRNIGEDVQQQACLLTAPKQLTAIDLGLLASAGLYEIQVKRKIRIAFFSTGDELQPIGTALAAGQIYDSNRYLLAALLQNPCHLVTDLGVLPDHKKQIQQCLDTAAKSHDIIISTGGASVGEADYIKEILDEIGNIHFWKLAIKPGKPLAFGRINHSYFFGLPGNPISVLATFQQIVHPALRQLIGLHNNTPLRFKATCQSLLFKRAGRKEFQRGILSKTPSGNYEVVSSGKQGSNILSASSRANCYIILEQDQENINIGEQVLVEPFSLYL